MTYTLAIKPEVDKIFAKLTKKNKKQYEIIMKKIAEILENPQHYKNLRSPLEDWKRVHIDRSFVLCFSVNENTRTVTLEDYDHHDHIYKK
jgi:YafQ family addiction module toxin component